MRRYTDSELISAGLTIYERPRPRFSGRESDIDQPYKAVAIGHVDSSVRAPERPLGTPLWDVPTTERRAFQSARTSAAADGFTSSWETVHGHVKVADRTKFYTGTCQQCSKSFTVSRPASRRGKWPSVCSDECKAARRRHQTAAAVRKHRQRR